MRRYRLACWYLNPLPQDEGMTFEIELLARSRQHAVQRLRRYVSNSLVVAEIAVLPSDRTQKPTDGRSPASPSRQV